MISPVAAGFFFSVYGLSLFCLGIFFGINMQKQKQEKQKISNNLDLITQETKNIFVEYEKVSNRLSYLENRIIILERTQGEKR